MPHPNALYGVWASGKPGEALRLNNGASGLRLSGTKAFCSGAGIVDRALVSVGSPEQLLLDVDLTHNEAHIIADESAWKTSAFHETRTSTVTFNTIAVFETDIIGESGWYLERPGFWHGACGPAACWAGGALGIVDYALQQDRTDPHTLAHLGALTASAWALASCLDSAGREIDEQPEDREAAMIRALTVRHLVEQACTDVLRRLARAYGPYPLAMDESMGCRYLELDLYLRQSHAERDLEALGEASRKRYQRRKTAAQGSAASTNP